MSGLVLITLPIGNNKDITIRAKETIEKTSFIIAEDTRVFKDFCRRNAIVFENKHIQSFHDHSHLTELNQITQAMKEQLVALVSDAGSPIVSDPAFPIVQQAIIENIPVYTNPGVSSIITALELSGLPPVPFHFHAFIPRDHGKKEKFIEQITEVYGTHIFFEGVARVEKTMDMMSKMLPDLSFCIARELTKEYESIYRFNGKEWKNIKEQMIYKGEFVILVNNSLNNCTHSNSQLKQLAKDILDGGAHPKKLSKLLAKVLDLSSKEVYQKLQQFQK